ncbi:MAG: efflux transporter outer membrane subunit [Woeseia sp.]|nr:efflux transporter outer membrane subunit [Woeseia sp.]
MNLLKLFPSTAVAILAGCTVGPDYEAVVPDVPDEFVNAEGIEGKAAQPVAGLWQSLGNENLLRLIELATANNTTIAQAEAALAESRALSGIRVFSLFPTGTINNEFERNSQSSSDPFAFGGQGIVERYRSGFDMVWEIDLFGSLRRESEAFVYRVEATEANLYAVEIAIIAEVAQSYFQWRGASLRRELLKLNLQNQVENVSILEAGFEAGRGTALDVARARAVERSLAATLPTAEVAIVRAEQRISALTRLPVADLRATLDAPSAALDLPALIAVGEPVEWLLRRPDVRAAERQLAAATADIGVELAELYPQLNLVGDFGWTGRTSSAIGESSAERWRVAPGLSWRILDYGRVRQTIKAARARAAGALAAFDEAWLTALEETEIALANYKATTERVAILEDAALEGNEAARLATLRFDAGADGYLSVVDANRTQIELDDQLALARTDRATALVALYKALGGDFAHARQDGL